MGFHHIGCGIGIDKILGGDFVLGTSVHRLKLRVVVVAERNALN